MNDLQTWTQSKTVLVLLIGFVAWALQQTGVVLDLQSQNQIVEEIFKIIQGAVAIYTGAAYLLGVYYRIRATKQIVSRATLDAAIK